MSIRLNLSVFDAKIIITGQLPSNRGTQVLFGKDKDGKRFSVIIHSYLLPRKAFKGECWLFKGIWDSNPKYTNQIIAEHGEPMPLAAEYLEEYITQHPRLRVGEGFTRVGKITWENAINSAGNAEKLSIILNDKDIEAIKALKIGRLTRNITPILNAWHTLKKELEGIQLLTDYKVEKRLSRKLIRYYGEQVVDLLTINCFKLLAFSQNTKALFDSCIQISQSLKYPQNDPRYLQGAIDFIFNYRLDNYGHTAISKETLYRALLNHFKDKDIALTAINSSLATGALVMSPRELLQIRPVHFVEGKLEHHLINLLKKKNKKTLWSKEKLLNEFKKVLTTSAHPLTGEQEEAIKQPFISTLSILTGGAGTGKTTVISSIVKLASKLNIPVFQMALSGQAADVMRHYNSIHNIQCITKTIHSYLLPLEEMKNQENNQESPHQTKELKYPNECLIIIDESSMVDLSLMSRLMYVIPNTARVLLVGDPNQIPPIGAGLVFHKLCHSIHIPISRLTKPHRSAAETGIPLIAEKISHGHVPPLPLFKLDEPTPKHGVYFLPATIDKSDKHCLAKVIFKVVKKLGFENTQVITTHRKKANKFGSIQSSVHHINDYFQQELTKGKQKELITWGLNENDPIIVRKNVINIGKKGFDLFNGNLGILKSADKPYTFQFGNIERELDDNAIAQLGVQLGYALTVHSFQGSAADCVVIAITKSNLLERSLLYTALTRAKKTCVFVGDFKAFQDAVEAPPKWKTICTAFDIDRYFEKKD